MTRNFVTLVNGIPTLQQAPNTSTPNSIPSTGADGTLSPGFMPPGTQTQVLTLTAKVEIAAGKFFAVDSTDGQAILADASSGHPAKGFVLETVTANASGSLFYLLGKNTAVTVAGNYRGYVWLGTTGGFVTTPPAVGTGGVVAGHLLQNIGYCPGGNVIVFETDMHYILNA